MKKNILIVLVIMTALLGTTAYAKEGVAKVAKTGWSVVSRLTADAGWYEKTVDESTGVVCYSFQNKSAVSISCVKK